MNKILWCYHVNETSLASLAERLNVGFKKKKKCDFLLQFGHCPLLGGVV